MNILVKAKPNAKPSDMVVSRIFVDKKGNITDLHLTSNPRHATYFSTAEVDQYKIEIERFCQKVELAKDQKL